MFKILHTIFDDKRLSIFCVMTWLTLLFMALYSLGFLHASFMTFGPSSHTKIMTMTIDNWYSWSMVAIASFISTVVSDFFGDSISPFIVNTIQDHKGQYLPYSKFQCFIIVQLWSFYCIFMSVFSLGLLTSQLDFIIIRTVADLLVNGFTTFKFLSHKRTEPALYYADFFRQTQNFDPSKSDFNENDSVCLVNISKTTSETAKKNNVFGTNRPPQDDDTRPLTLSRFSIESDDDTHK